MKKLHQLITLGLVLTFATVSIYGQDPQDQEEETQSAAYMESRNTAHWSIYIPIAILVGTAIWFGIADQHQGDHSSDSQDGLGRMDSSKRISRHSCMINPSKTHRRSCSCSSSGSYSH